MKSILLITMGGTISAEGKSRYDLKDYVSGKYSGEDFLKEVSHLSEIAKIDIKEIANVSSTEINEGDWHNLNETITSAFNDAKYDGVVITHGTNTLEETAYFLHLTLPNKQAVVLVGAQRPFTALSTDAHINLFHAIQVAAHPEAGEKGVLVVANGEIHSARNVTKTDTYQLNTFQSPTMGPLGFISPDDTVQFYHSPTRKHTYLSEFTNLSNKYIPKIGIIYSYAGATGELVDQITKDKLYDGIVVAGTGAGRCSPSEDSALKKAADNGITIVRSSRVGHGRVVGIDAFKNYPSIKADNLNPQKARILLMIALSIYTELDKIQAVFDTY